MIISINFPTPSTSSSAPKLPPALAKISHDELVLIELQGALEVECNHDSERDGRLVGRLCIDEAGKKPTLMIGHHLLEGKIAQLPKPLAVIQRVSNAGADADAMDCDDPEDSQRAETRGTGTVVSWDAIAVVKRKIVFAKRPMPIVGRTQA
ncbi:Ctf8-domain-containing protein [Mycena alexandri]|uniref:Ctf8-domain-containing protein n=1 Tax=Mycena alexandri TaxID=1745969 RepID=A0AAD6SDM4_9AGAR|nr:Ctf8-domain-containing protein [Mycena alexandri]